MIILSGMGPDLSGVGRLMSCLVDQAATRPVGDTQLVWRLGGKPIWRYVRRGQIITAVRKAANRRRWQRMLTDFTLLNADPLILIHPQSLGFHWCQQFIQNRRTHTWMYLMDSSFFCLRSYNHVDGEMSSCQRCLGGDWQQAEVMNCEPFPFADSHAKPFVRHWHRWVSDGRVRCLVQNQRQAELIHAHCGPQAITRVVGLWTADMNDLPDRSLANVRPNGTFDVVFHGVPHLAKGFHWALEVAKRCESLRFLFPCDKRFVKSFAKTIPANVCFQPMTWETGLAEHVTTASIVLVPSLWSATIEGALVKSLLAARGVAVVNQPTAWSSQLPEGLLLRLPADFSEAAKQLVDAVQDNWSPPQTLWQDWADEFKRANLNLLARLRSVCCATAEQESALGGNHARRSA